MHDNENTNGQGRPDGGHPLHPEGPATPPVQSSLEAEVDVEVLRSVPRLFLVNSESSANWLVRRVAQARRYAERIDEWADREKRRPNREEYTLMFLYGRQLAAWVSDEIERLGGNRKSICLPGGTVGYRTAPQRLVIDDVGAVIAWAQTNCPEAVKTGVRLLKSALDQRMKESGEIPATGAHVEPERQIFFVR